MAVICEYGDELSGSIKAGNFLTSCKPVSFSRSTLLHAASKKVLKHSIQLLNTQPGYNKIRDSLLHKKLKFCRNPDDRYESRSFKRCLT